MKKDFKKWHNKKSKINEIEKRPFFHEREVWFCHLGVNVGFEQDGDSEEFLRPVVIIRKFNNEIFWGVPLTKGKKPISEHNLNYYYSFNFITGIESIAIISQIRLIDARRLSRHIGTVNESDINHIIEKLKALLP